MSSSSSQRDVSAGIVAYLHAGTAASPQADDEAVPPGVLAEVEALVAESLEVPVDWSAVSLGDARRFVATEMSRRHPELSTEAADALAWNFTYAWR